MRQLAERILLGMAMLVMVASCAAVRQQKAQPPATDDFHFHNLQVLPQNIAREELLITMKRFTQALGVRCGHCHVQTATEPRPQFDFPSDAKPDKKAARVMMRMTRTINQDYVRKIPEMHTTVTCWTCHRGSKQPDVTPSMPE